MRLALLMPGQGAQYRGMGTGLYREMPAFAKIVDQVFEAMDPAGEQVRSAWLAADPEVVIDQAGLSQPLLFAIDYALGRLLQDMGLRPDVLLGHSIGEMAAATLAGIFDLGDAVRVLRDRVDQLANAPAGGMVAVAASREQVERYLRPGVDIGAVNAPRQTVIAGADRPLGTVTDALRQAGFTVAPVFSLTPFHSAVLAPVAQAARGMLAAVPMRPPGIPMISGYTGRGLAGTEAVDPGYWARHPTDPVLFWPALQTLLASDRYLLVECGPGQGLITLARRHPDVRSGRSAVCALIGARPEAEADQFAAALKALSSSAAAR